MSARWLVVGPAEAEASAPAGSAVSMTIRAVLPLACAAPLRGTCDDPGMDMTLRFEIFPADLDAVVDFYVRVLGFRIAKDEREDPEAYVAMQRGSVHVGALRQNVPVSSAGRRPPAGVELVLEVDDVASERDRVVAAGWPLAEDLQLRSWGLTDFRILDPAGYYLRITDRARQ
jgi:lactoylglutathione lyase